MSDLFGQYEYSAEANQASFKLLLEAVLKQNPQALMILCSDKGLEQRDYIDPILISLEIPVFGGVFPAIIIDTEVLDEGVLMVPIYTAVEIKVYRGLESAPSNPFDVTCGLSEYQSAMILIDGLSRNIDFALNQIFEQFGKKLKVFGGGAGSLSFEHKPCLFSNQGVLMDAMVVVFMQLPWELAVGHGWEVLEGPFLANDVDDNKIIQLNYQPAVDVYENVIERFSSKKFTDCDFFELAKTYPFGIERLDDELLVRDPVSVEKDSLVCVGKVPENTMLYILKGQSSSLASAAVEAVENAVTTSFCEQGLLFDCISRQLFLEKEFKSELQGITSALCNSGLIGVLALGEIASGVSGAIHFHNKTSVTAIAGKPQGKPF